jgi:hypothetical protein
MHKDAIKCADAEGSSAHSCLSRPNSRSTALRGAVEVFERLDSRGMSGCSGSALRYIDAGLVGAEDLERADWLGERWWGYVTAGARRAVGEARTRSLVLRFVQKRSASAQPP